MTRRGLSPVAFTLVELLVVIGILVLLISILLPSLTRARQRANELKMGREKPVDAAQALAADARPAIQPTGPSLPPARVRSFVADVALTPRLSVGTLDPESIYEASMSARIEAAGPPGAQTGGECVIPCHCCRRSFRSPACRLLWTVRRVNRCNCATAP